MIIAVIADSHDNEANIHLALHYLASLPVDAMIHCGDICTPETLKLLAREFPKPIHVVYGNVDYDRAGLDKMLSRYPDLHGYGDSGALELGGINVAFNHFPKEAKQLAATGKYGFVFYGHTHKPWEEKIGTTTLLNPGTLSGMWYKATFALVDLKTGKATLKLVEQLIK
ncbi:MAG: YfcE family phosphodiesterase [Patescibacteria group bacterium]|nr:YfcE family phosphodiesterase [Patescibacteria group bacterium]